MNLKGEFFFFQTYELGSDSNYISMEDQSHLEKDLATALFNLKIRL